MSWADGLLPLQHRPGDADPDPVRAERSRVGVTRRKERKFDQVPNPWGLSGAEVACLRALASGLSQAEAAKDLIMSHKTVQTHVHRAKEKVGASTTVQAVVFFDRWMRDQKEDVEVVLRYVAGCPSVELRRPQAEEAT